MERKYAPYRTEVAHDSLGLTKETWVGNVEMGRSVLLHSA